MWTTAITIWFTFTCYISFYYLEDNKYEEKFNIDKKFSFIYSLICIADKIMKNKLPYKMNTSNLIIVTKDNKEYLKDNFNDLEIEKIKNKNEEQSILFDLSIIIINILLGENISEEKINKNPKFICFKITFMLHKFYIK